MASETVPEDRSEVLHASTVELDGRALLILGPSGSGKSTLALDLIALGASLVADDRTIVTCEGDRLIASPPVSIAGQIEARYVGLLRLPYSSHATVTLAIDLGQQEPDRLPPSRTLELLGQKATLLYRPPGGQGASALLQCLMERREMP